MGNVLVTKVATGFATLAASMYASKNGKGREDVCKAVRASAHMTDGERADLDVQIIEHIKAMATANGMPVKAERAKQARSPNFSGWMFESGSAASKQLSRARLIYKAQDAEAAEKILAALFPTKLTARKVDPLAVARKAYAALTTAQKRAFMAHPEV